MSDTKNTKKILEEAVEEYKEIKKAAEASAIQKLSKEYETKLSKMIAEELDIKVNKTKINESVEETEPINVKENPEDMNSETTPQDGDNKDNMKIQEYDENTIEDKTEEPEFTLDGIENDLKDSNEDGDEEKLDISVGKDVELDSALLAKLAKELEKVIELIEGGKTEDTEDKETIAPSVDDQPENDEIEGNDEVTDNEVDEIYSQSLSLNKTAGAQTMPRPEYFKDKYNKLRLALRNLTETYEKKHKSLISENMKNIKELNSIRKSAIETKKNLNIYKEAYEKSKNLVTEMAIFNTNLANVNNILLDESLALTTADKKNIVNEFKNIKDISESKSKFNQIISEMKSEKKVTIKESLLDKVDNNIISPSSAKTLDESLEKNKINDNPNMIKIKKNMGII